MKKFFTIILAAMLCVTSFALFVGCGNNDKSRAVVSGSDVSDGLQYDVKYVSRASIRNEDPKNYYKFNADGTGMYSSKGYYYDYSYVTEIYFKYTYADAQHTGVVCFFDSYKRIWDYEGEEIVTTEPSENDKKWYAILSVSKDIVMSQGMSSISVYVNENYIEQIPNYEP